MSVSYFSAITVQKEQCAGLFLNISGMLPRIGHVGDGPGGRGGTTPLFFIRIFVNNNLKWKRKMTRTDNFARKMDEYNKETFSWS